jgi:hypothetical protein
LVIYVGKHFLGREIVGFRLVVGRGGGVRAAERAVYSEGGYVNYELDVLFAAEPRG